MRTKKKLRARTTASEGSEGRNQETTRQGVVATALGWEVGEPILAITNLLGDLGLVPKCQDINFPRGTMRRQGGCDPGSGGGGAQEAGLRSEVTADTGRPARGRAGAAHPPSATWQALRSWECWGRFTSLSARIFSRARDTNMLLVWLSCMAPARRGLVAPRADGVKERVREPAGSASRPAPAASVRVAPSGSDAAIPRRRHVGARHVTT